MKFQGKTSKWWYIVTVAFNIAAVAAFFFTNMNSNAIMLYIPPCIIVDLYLIPVIFNNYVTINKKEMVIHFGLLRKTISPQDITEMMETRATSSSFSASFDRIAIDSKGIQTIYISVEDKDGFLKEAKKANKRIKFSIG